MISGEYGDKNIRGIWNVSTDHLEWQTSKYDKGLIWKGIPFLRIKKVGEMTPKLNSEQLQALHDGDDRPVEVVDPETNRVYILLAREHYERLKPLFEESPISPEEQREIIRDAGRRAGWDDPEMDVYDRYDDERPKQP